MPEAARLIVDPTLLPPVMCPSPMGQLHGEVGEMHRAIERRLLSEPFVLTVIPLPISPAEKLFTSISRLVGWATLAGSAAGASACMIKLLG